MPLKPHLHRKADGTLPTASEVARTRKLAEIGKDLAWYYAEVDASRNEHGEPTCAECHRPETKKLPTGQIKMLTIDTKNFRLVCESCAQKQYKQSMKDKAAMRQNVDGASNLDAFWTRNRNKLSQSQIEEYENRQTDILLLTEEVGLCTIALKENFPFNREAMNTFIREVCESVTDNGFSLPDLALVPFYTPEFSEFYALWTGASHDNVAVEYRKSMPIYMQFGFLTAIPEYSVFRFFEQAERYLGLPSGNFETVATRIIRILDALEGRIYQIPDRVIRCATSGCKSTDTVSPNTRVKPEWFCPSCEDERNRKGHEVLSRILDKRLKDERLARMVAEAESRDTLFGEDGRFNG